jgi:MFS transporter, DHA2 family, multidrug resistance protein
MHSSGSAGTPASHSLTGSVPVTRSGMASGTADLQRDLGGALLTSIFGALLAAGYSSAMGAAVTASPEGQSVTESTQSQLQLSFSSAADLAAQNPKYADQILSAAKESFLKGDNWAYLAGAVAIVLGAILVFFMFPKKDDEKRLLAEYRAEGGS